MERPRRRLLANSDRVSTTYEITSEKRLAQNDVTHLIKAHHRRPQRGHVGFVGSVFLPTPPFQVVIDDVAVVGKFAGEEVLEAATPQVHEPVVANNRRKPIDLPVPFQAALPQI